MAAIAFNFGSNNPKVYLGDIIWSRDSTFGTDQSITLSIPKGAIGLICTCSTNTYWGSFSTPTVGTVLISESRSSECRGPSMMVLLLTEPLKSNSSVVYYYGSGSGCNYRMYPIMLK